MGIRFVVLLIFAFIFELFFLSKELKFKDSQLMTKKIDIEFINSQTYDMDINKINSILVCNKIQQVGEKKLFFNPIATLFDENITKNIIADKAILDDKTNQIVLNNNIKIIYNDKKLTTQMLKYDLPSSTILDSSKFIMISKDILASGEHLFFDTKKSIIKAKDINYTLFIRE